MPKVTKIKAHLSPEELKQHMHQETKPWRIKRWEILYSLTVHPRKAEQVATDLGVSKSAVHKLVMNYNAKGKAALDTPGKGGRRCGYMTLPEEEEFMASMIEPAQKGFIVTAACIKNKYEEKVGHKVHMNMIYQLMERHSWKKKFARPQHSKTDPVAQEEFKKNFLKTLEI